MIGLSHTKPSQFSVSFLTFVPMASEQTIERINGCVIMPTYNNDRTLERVLLGILEHMHASRVIVVNDGSTDRTAAILENYSDSITILANNPNAGKGMALRKGLRNAIEKGFDHAITIDSDGQHYPEDLPKMIAACVASPNTVLMGSRNMEQEGVPQKSSFGNKFSNFWFKVETWISLPDTQTGFRVYPLKPLTNMRLFSRKFELEIEVIVRLAWKNVPFQPVPIRVKYDPEERVSHFRPGPDFFRISVLNSLLVLIALFYYYPKKFLSLKTLGVIRDEAIKPEESNMSKALSLGFGVFMGIVPIWGFQLLIGIPIAIFFRMNKVLFIAAANISFPPMIPFILYASYWLGQLIVTGEVNHSLLDELTIDNMGKSVAPFVIGSMSLATSAGLTFFAVSYLLLKLFRKEPKPD
jgi:glycosyltransferase involved in cell wall biosynthesis